MDSESGMDDADMGRAKEENTQNHDETTWKIPIKIKGVIYE